MIIVIISKLNEELDFYVNEVTEFLDKFLISNYDYTYIYSEPYDVKDGLYVFRCQGATRGYLQIEKGIIKDIKLYDLATHYKVGCYSKDVIEAIKKYIGKEIDLGR